MYNQFLRCVFRIFNNTLQVSTDVCPLEAWDAYFDYTRVSMPPGLHITLTISDLTKPKVNIFYYLGHKIINNQDKLITIYEDLPGPKARLLTTL